MIYIGTMLHGHCNGFFDCDTCQDKRVEAMGADWLVARDATGMALFASFRSTEEMLKKAEEWVAQESSDDQE